MLPLTPRQANFLSLIRSLTKSGVSPTYEELAEAAGVQKSQVHYMLHRLKDRGHVTFEKGRARTLRIVEQDLPSLDGFKVAQLVRLRDQIDAVLAAKFSDAR